MLRGKVRHCVLSTKQPCQTDSLSIELLHTEMTLMRTRILICFMVSQVALLRKLCMLTPKTPTITTPPPPKPKPKPKADPLTRLKMSFDVVETRETLVTARASVRCLYRVTGFRSQPRHAGEEAIGTGLRHGGFVGRNGRTWEQVVIAARRGRIEKHTES